ncbi:MAG: trypsin-like peptidase domain-containing protein [Gammaproteobacteria bacterium]|nr:trypsin-like peptidase domain-containing protein [Gammaproteobacteria bacterium]
MNTSNRLSQVFLGIFAFLFCVNTFAVDKVSWETIVDRVSESVISLKVDSARPFDTSRNSSQQATGFVVDAKRGIILTNRHVVQPGPVMAVGMFLNHEEVDLKPIYRDPVHDFGFFQYDPAELSFNNPVELKLNPDAAVVGKDIRVIGNDGGEHLSILSGTLARLDRRAPNYGQGSYNDFNTFYMQAASSISGGASGSPVVDMSGDVIALSAGANLKNAASFFLPLDRITRALKLIQADQPVSRGTLQTIFWHQPYEELRRLGLSHESETLVRDAHPKGIGMLVVNQVIRKGVADGLFMPGDILLKANGQLMTSFPPLAELLDNSVGDQVVFDIERAGTLLSVTLKVADLHAITPASYITFGGGLLHDLSYQQARNYHVPVEGVYIASSGYVLGNESVVRGVVITSMNDQPIRNLDDLKAVLATLADGDQASIRFFNLGNPNHEMVAVISMDRRWFPVKACERDDKSGYWPCRALAEGPKVRPLKPASTQFTEVDDPKARAIAPSLAIVTFEMPFRIDGVRDSRYIGTGVVLDATKGLIVVDQNTVPTFLGNVNITFAGSLEVPGKVEFVHPFHNMAVVSYDPALIGDTPVKSAEFVNQPLKQGDRVWQVGLKGNHQLTVQSTTIRSVDAAIFPVPSVPWFRDTNIEVAALTNSVNSVGAVLANEDGKIIALWANFAYQTGKKINSVMRGIPSELVMELIDVVSQSPASKVRSLEVELYLLPLSEARKRGLPNEWVTMLEAHNTARREVLLITRLVAGSPAAGLLTEGDLLLALNGTPVTNFRDVEKAVRDKEIIDVTILRRGKEQILKVPTVSLSGMGTDRVVGWSGALLQAPHRSIAAQRGYDADGVYIAWTWWGSPANHFGLAGSLRILNVDGVAVPDLDAFLSVVQTKKHRDSVRLKVVDLNGRENIVTLKLDLNYWPTYELKWTQEDGWRRYTL